MRATAKSNRKHATETRDVQVALCPPACRMVYVSAWFDEGRAHTSVEPVVAIESVIRRRYGKSYVGATPPAWCGTESELRREGWRLQGESVETRAVVVGADGWLVTSDDDDACNGASALVAAPWPPEQDDERLAGIKARLCTEATNKVESIIPRT